MKEKDLYKPVAEFIEAEFDCFAVKINRGTRYGTIDVVGLRYVMDSLGGATEVIAVEVKPERNTVLKALGQASAYSVMADRCYLAVHTPYNRRVTYDVVDMASQLGVGLIEIGARKACTVVVSSPRREPIQAHRLNLIGAMGYVECVICGRFFEPAGIRSNRERSSLRDATKEEEGFRWWLEDLAEQRGARQTKYVYDRRHLCADCVGAFSGVVQGE